MSLTTAQAADVAGMTRAAFRGAATRARADGVELRLARDAWPDGRTPLYDEATLRVWLAARPGQGRRNDIVTKMSPATANLGHCTRGGTIASGKAECECGEWRASDYSTPDSRKAGRKEHFDEVLRVRLHHAQETRTTRHAEGTDTP